MRVCLAGALSKRFLLAQLGAKSVLMSFAEVKKKSPGARRELMKWMREHFEFVLVDSGAHSFFNEYGVGKHERSTSLGSPEAWHEDYVSFIVDNKDYADAFVELDIADLPTHTIEDVLKLRKEAHDGGVPKDKLLPVYHWTIHEDPRETLRMWEAWCEEYRYCGTGGDGYKGQGGVAGLRPVLEVARKYQTKLHGFAVTSVPLLQQMPMFYSVDSTSWLAGSMFGVTYDLMPNGFMKQVAQDGNRELQRAHVLRKLAKQGIEVPQEMQDQYLADKGDGVDYVNGLMWTRFEEKITERQAQRKMNYWDLDYPEVTVINEDEECTCDNMEKGGACKRHGRPAHGMVPVNTDLSPALREANKGSLSGVVHGRTSDRLPQAACDDCYLSGRCPKFQDGGFCAFDEQFMEVAKPLETRSLAAVETFLLHKLQIDTARYMKNVLIEQMDGGRAIKEVDGLSRQIDRSLQLLAKFRGQLKEAPVVDARQVTLILDGLSEEQFTRLLKAKGAIDDIAPGLLSRPEE